MPVKECQIIMTLKLTFKFHFKNMDLIKKDILDQMGVIKTSGI